MITEIITTLSEAFDEVVKLVTNILGDGFEAVGQLSSGVFGGAEGDSAENA